MHKEGDKMKDEEFIKLKNNFFKSVFFVLLFIVPFTIALITKFGTNNTNIENKIRNKETMLILITEKKCNKCREIKDILKKQNVNFYEINIDKTTINDYQRILRKIKISENDIVIPTMIYVEEGNLKSSLVDIKNKNELLSYIENIS